ncbi:MAG: glycosyltransferase family 39 protein [Burkholderiaceae bacterium]|nr:glycosyltransferase family 39 protein [Burkholderiaceae bacterium]
MSLPLQAAHPATGARNPSQAVMSIDLALVLGLALLWRLLFFNGPFGSDDGVYLQRALDVATGAWTSADYNGALRYGYNIPAGLMMLLFGRSIAAANLWPLLCSLAEVALLYVFLRELLDRRAASIGSLLLGTAPLHIAVATRIHADPVVSFFLTAAFVATFMGLRRRSSAWCLAAGIALGGVYWSKELAAVVYFAFVPLLWYFRRYAQGVAWALTGLSLMLVANGLLMLWIAGDPLHTVRVVLGSLSRSFIQEGGGEDSPLYYLRYLFLDPRHLGLLGWLAVAGLWGWLRRSANAGTTAGPVDAGVPGLGFVVFWLLGLLLVLSAFPVSLSPLRFTMKQSNYISLFLAPLAAMAAVAVSGWRPRWRSAAMLATMALGLLLGALQQADYRVFTANSKGIARVMQGRDDALLVGNRSHSGIAAMQATLTGQPVPVVNYSEAASDPAAFSRRASGARELLAAVDPQTAAWFGGSQVLTKPRPCWRLHADVTPLELGLGNRLAAGIASAARRIPGQVSAKVATAAVRLAAPEPAWIYAVPAGRLWCDAP